MCWCALTFVAVPHRVEVDGELEELEADPGAQAVDRHHEQDAHNPQLLQGWL